MKKTVESLNGKYVANLYLCDSGATTDYAVRGEIVDDKKEKQIDRYDADDKK